MSPENDMCIVRLVNDICKYLVRLLNVAVQEILSYGYFFVISNRLYKPKPQYIIIGIAHPNMHTLHVYVFITRTSDGAQIKQIFACKYI